MPGLPTGGLIVENRGMHLGSFARELIAVDRGVPNPALKHESQDGSDGDEQDCSSEA